MTAWHNVSHTHSHIPVEISINKSIILYLPICLSRVSQTFENRNCKHLHISTNIGGKNIEGIQQVICNLAECLRALDGTNYMDNSTHD